jgi:hypothetical protein
MVLFYGRLYNWYAASNPLFAPVGGHVPTQAELDILRTAGGGEDVAGAGADVCNFESYSPSSGLSVRLIKDDSTDPNGLTDIDGNVYRTTKIGDQVWLADNWACTKLNDGTEIPNVTDDTEWAASTIPAYCNYSNDISNVFL